VILRLISYYRSMLRKKEEPREPELWIPADQIVLPASTDFYTRLNVVLDAMRFGDQVRALCEPYYSTKSNVRPPIDPEVYFKMLLVGFFENIGSERGIASRCADSLSIRSFLRYALTEQIPDHSTLSVIRHRLPELVYQSVFMLVLSELRSRGLVRGKHLGVDSSVIEANAALRSLRHRMTEQSYTSYVRGLARAAGVDPEDPAAVARFDRKRPGRKTSNQEWHNPHDPDAKVSRDKHGATDMLYKTEHVVDLETGAIVSAMTLPADQGDTEGLTDRIGQAQVRLEEIGAPEAETVTADKGYFKASEVMELQARGLETIIPDRHITRVPENYTEAERVAIQRAAESVRTEEGKTLLRKRGQHIERSFAHVLDSGGCRRTSLRHITNLQKRQLVATFAFNLSLLMRTVTGIGTPKQLAAAAERLKNAISEYFSFWGDLGKRGNWSGAVLAIQWT
jgi:transposase